MICPHSPCSNDFSFRFWAKPLHFNTLGHVSSLDGSVARKDSCSHLGRTSDAVPGPLCARGLVKFARNSGYCKPSSTLFLLARRGRAISAPRQPKTGDGGLGGRKGAVPCSARGIHLEEEFLGMAKKTSAI